MRRERKGQSLEIQCGGSEAVDSDLPFISSKITDRIRRPGSRARVKSWRLEEAEHGCASGEPAREDA